MKEIKVVQYQADDGKVFDTKYECERYEAELTDRTKLTIAFNTILDYCQNYSVEHYIISTNSKNLCSKELQIELGCFVVPVLS